MNSLLLRVGLATLCGLAARLMLLRLDYRQYPSLPQGVLVHGTLGLIAAALGAMAVPALAAEEYAAVTFLALAATQFRDVRQMERDSLLNSEKGEMLPRGKAYVEDIARRFEARNYVAMLTALVVSLALHVGLALVWAIACGVGIAIVLAFATYPQKLNKIADVKASKLQFEGPLLMVEDIVIANVGLESSRQRWREYGVACVVHPKDDNARNLLAQPGQRVAMVYDVGVQLGFGRSEDEGELMPMARIDALTGKVAIVSLVAEPDEEAMVQAIRECPVLESAARSPLASKAGRMAAD